MNRKYSRNISEQPVESGCDDEISFVEYWRLVKKHIKLIGIIVGVATLVSVVYSLSLPKIYRAETVIMPLGGGGNSIAALAAQFTGLPLMGGIGGAKTPERRLLVLLNSRTLAERIVRKFELAKVYYKDLWDEENKLWKVGVEPPTMEQAVNALRASMQFSSDTKNGIINISAESVSPQLAKDLADSYVVNLQEYINEYSFTQAKRNRIFVESQLIENKKDLFEVGKGINEFYKEGRVSDVESRINVLLGATNEVNFGTGVLMVDNSNLKNRWYLLQEPTEILAKRIKDKEIKVVEDVPQQVYLQYLILRRELLGQINALLTQQYEMAKIEESKEDLAFQVIDPAKVPSMRCKPQRKMIVMVSFFVSLILALFIAFFLEHLEKTAGKTVKIRFPFFNRKT